MPLTSRVLMKKKKKKESLQGLSPGCSLTLLTARNAGGGGGWFPGANMGTAGGCGGQEDYAIRLSLKESIAFPPTHVRPR